MRSSVVLRLVSAAALALVAGSAMSSPASAFAGLSDKQAAHIEKFIKCKTFLLKGDRESFAADPDCGGKGPVTFPKDSIAGSGGGNGGPKIREECRHEYPTGSLL